MTVLDPSRRPWDVTPKRYITTTSHRVRHDPELNRKVEQAQFTQSQVYDTVLEHFDRHTALPLSTRISERTSTRSRGIGWSRSLSTASATGGSSA